MTTREASFNEAAGIHRRKLDPQGAGHGPEHQCFNEAAGITGGNENEEEPEPTEPTTASMRPPEFTGGNATNSGSTYYSDARLQ